MDGRHTGARRLIRYIFPAAGRWRFRIRSLTWLAPGPGPHPLVLCFCFCTRERERERERPGDDSTYVLLVRRPSITIHPLYYVSIEPQRTDGGTWQCQGTVNLQCKAEAVRARASVPCLLSEAFFSFEKKIWFWLL